jgi:predicted nucleic acid-binding protein
VQYFFDTSFFIALIDRRDLHHKRAVDILKTIQETSNESPEFFLSDVVLNETWSVICRRVESRKNSESFALLAQSLQQKITAIPVLCLYEIFNDSYQKVVKFMRENQGRFSFHDALIALFLRQVDDVTLVTFDHDFRALKNLKVLS